MKFAKRLDAVPPYLFAELERKVSEAERAGIDVISLGIGDPDLPTPPSVIEALAEAARDPRTHHYPTNHGTDEFRAAAVGFYRDRFGVELDPEREVTMSLGAKEGLVHLLWVLLGPGDAALVPSPSYPIHLFAPGFAGATVARVGVGAGEDFYANVEEAWHASQPRPRVLLCSFPHNPTTACADPGLMQRLVDFARERDVLLVHDFAYADLGFDGYRPPSIFEAEGAREVAVELYSLTKGFSVPGWRVAFVLGRADVVGALARLKSYLDYGSFQALQIAATVVLRDAADYPAEVAKVYEGRRNALCDRLDNVGWHVERPAATMFVWAPIPTGEAAQPFAVRLLREGHVAVSPGSGFGEDGEGFVRFALVENEQRIAQAVRGIRRVVC